MTLLAVIAFAAAAVFLFLGIRSMAHGGAEDQAQSTHYMAMRLASQGIAIVLVLLGMLALFRTW
jgi:hypothetical protein